MIQCQSHPTYHTCLEIVMYPVYPAQLRASSWQQGKFVRQLIFCIMLLMWVKHLCPRVKTNITAGCQHGRSTSQQSVIIFNGRQWWIYLSSLSPYTEWQEQLRLMDRQQQEDDSMDASWSTTVGWRWHRRQRVETASTTVGWDDIDGRHWKEDDQIITEQTWFI